MQKYHHIWVTYEDMQHYGISRDVLHVLKFKGAIPSRTYKKDGKNLYFDINWFIRRNDYKLKARDCGQKAVYFLEMFGSTVSAARLVAETYGGNELSLTQCAHYDLFSSENDSLTSLRFSEVVKSFFKMYRKIKARLNIAGLTFDDAFEDDNYEKAKTVYDSLLKNDEVVTMKDFDKVEDYFDYFEARRHLEDVRKKTARAA